jgi:hypothetical protein
MTTALDKTEIEHPLIDSRVRIIQERQTRREFISGLYYDLYVTRLELACQPGLGGVAGTSRDSFARSVDLAVQEFLLWQADGFSEVS